MNLAIILMTIFQLCLSCSDKSAPPTYQTPDTLVPVDGFDEVPLGVVTSFSEGLNIKDQRISAFVESNRRVSVIDTTDLSEKWGKTLDHEFKRSFPIPNLDGVFLVSNEFLMLATETEEYLVDLQGAYYNRYARAENKAVYIAIDDRTGNMAIVSKHDGSGVTDQIFELKPETVQPPSDDAAIPNSYIPFLTPSGESFIVVATSTGDYYQYSSEKNGFSSDPKKCLSTKYHDGDLEETDEFIQMSAAAMSADGSTFIFASAKNVLSYINIGEECQDAEATLLGGVSEDQQIVRIVARPGNEFLVLFATGIVKEFRIEDKGIEEISSVPSQCAENLVAANYLADNRLFTICLNETKSLDGIYFAVDLIISDPTSNQIVFNRTVHNKRVSGVALDSERSRIFLVGNDAIGKVEEIQYETSESKVNESFYIEGLLDRL